MGELDVVVVALCIFKCLLFNLIDNGSVVAAAVYHCGGGGASLMHGRHVAREK